MSVMTPEMLRNGVIQTPNGQPFMMAERRPEPVAMPYSGSGPQMMADRGDINPAGAGSDPFEYSLGSLLTPFKSFKAPTPTNSGGGGGGGYSVPASTPLNLQEFSFGWNQPGQFEGGPDYEGPATFNGARMANAPEFRSSVGPIDVNMYRGPGDVFRPGEGTELARYAPMEAYSGPGDITQDPGYQVRLREGQQAVENSRLAQGIGRGGGTLQALTRFGQDLASQEYAAADARSYRNWQGAADERRFGYQADTDRANTLYGRSASERDRQTSEANADWTRRVQANESTYGRETSEYDRREANRQAIERENYGRNFNETAYNEENRRNTFQMNRQNNLDAYRANAETAIASGNLNLNAATAGYDRNRENTMTLWGIAEQQRQEQMAAAAAGANAGRAADDEAYRRAMQEYGIEQENFRWNSDTQFNRLYALANLGQGSAGMVGNFGGQYANQAGNYYTGAGNALAAGQVGSANAWGGALNSIGNTVGSLAMYGSMNRSPRGGGYYIGE